MEYLELRPQAAPDWFNPGRGVNQSCLDYGRGEGAFQTNDPGDCLFVNDRQVLINQTEYVKTAGNLSDINQVYLAFHEGLQYSTLGPVRVPDNLDFQATSYGSHTECRMVTTECGAHSDFDDRVESLNVFNFACNNTMAGLNMTGNFANVGQSQENSNSSNGMVIENGNTMSQSIFGFGFQYFNDSAMREQVPTDLYGLSASDAGPITNTTHQYFWAVAFTLDIQLDPDNEHTRNPWSNLNLVVSAMGEAEGIMSCKTNISEIVRISYSHLQ